MNVKGNGLTDQNATISQRLQEHLPKIYKHEIGEAVVVFPVPEGEEKSGDSNLSIGVIISIAVCACVVIIIILTLVILKVALKNFNLFNCCTDKSENKKQNQENKQRCSLELPENVLYNFQTDNIEELIQQINQRWGAPSSSCSFERIVDSDPIVVNHFANLGCNMVNTTFSNSDPGCKVESQRSYREGITSNHRTCLRQKKLTMQDSMDRNITDDKVDENMRNVLNVPHTINPNLELHQIITKSTPAYCDVDLEIDVDRDLEVQFQIGYGAFGTVHKAVWTRNTTGEKIDVAVKFMSPWLVAELSGAEGQQHLKNFKEELALMCKMRHPNIVKCYGGCLKPPKLAIVLEFMQGGNLHNYIHQVRQENKLSIDEVLLIMSHIAAGLNYLHPSILHRDLKPKNVLLDQNGVPKISDFGLSKIRNSTISMTMNQIKGTPQYIAPEGWTGQPHISEKFDIYSLGIIAWEMLTGERPWYQCNTYMQISALITVFNKRPRIPDDCTKFLSELIQDCWDQDPKRRPSAGQIRKQIMWYYQKQKK